MGSVGGKGYGKGYGNGKGYGQGKWTREMAARDVAKGYGQKKSSKANRNNNPVKEGNSTK